MEKIKKLEILEKIKTDFIKVLQENVNQEDYLENVELFNGVFEMIGNELFIELLENRYYPLKFNWEIPEKVDKKFNFLLLSDMLAYIDSLLGEKNDKIKFY